MELDEAISTVVAQVIEEVVGILNSDDSMMAIWEKAIKPTLFDYGGKALVGSNSAGNLRFTLRFRDAEDLLAERGIAVSYETVRRWGNHFGPMIAAHLRKRRPKPHATWHLDEVYLKIDGRMVYLWRGRRRRGRGSRWAGPIQAQQARRSDTHA